MDAVDLGSVEYDSFDIDSTFAHACEFEQILEPSNWKEPAEYYQAMPTVTRHAVESVVASDRQLSQELRERCLPEMLANKTLLDWKPSNQEYIEALQRKRLYTGHVVAAYGSVSKYESLTLVGAQIAISQVNYQRKTGQIVSHLTHWGQEVPRGLTPEKIVQAVASRGQTLKEKVNNLFLQALKIYKEREMLLSYGPDIFKLINGPLFPHEMLSGVGVAHVLLPCLTLLGKIIDDGAYAAIASDDHYPELRVLGMALQPGEYIVIDDGTTVLNNFREDAHYVTTTPIPKYGGKSQIKVFDEFAAQYGPQVVRGILRAHHMSRPYVFYSNKARVKEAVHMLLADSANYGEYGFPLLLAMARQQSAQIFQTNEYIAHINAEFTRASHGSVIYQSDPSISS